MNINATLLGQMIAFGLFVWFCWKFVWPPLLAAMEERAAKIEQGLKDSEDSAKKIVCLLYTSPSPRDKRQSRMPSSA